jgi:DNA-binding FadR family transcriptional regulator
MLKDNRSFDLLEYIASAGNGYSERLPSLESLSAEHGVSISVLREQLQVARVLGLVEVKPRTGIRRLPYTFAPAVRESLSYALARDRHAFDQFADVRRHLERAYWFEAVERLNTEDIQHLQDLVTRADELLHGDPVRVPHAEHRELHLTIFQYLENPFVLGLLEAYWSAYEEVGLNRYAGIKYLEQVWDYHRKMVKALADGDKAKGHQLLNEHFDLIDKILD